MSTSKKTATNESAPADKQNANRPVHEVRLGRVRAAIWANDTEFGVRHNVTLSRLYKEKESDQWKDSTSFGRDDLPLLMKVADQVHTWIFEHGGENGSANGNGNENGNGRSDKEIPY